MSVTILLPSFSTKTGDVKVSVMVAPLLKVLCLPSKNQVYTSPAEVKAALNYKHTLKYYSQLRPKKIIWKLTNCHTQPQF